MYFDFSTPEPDTAFNEMMEKTKHITCEQERDLLGVLALQELFCAKNTSGTFESAVLNALPVYDKYRAFVAGPQPTEATE